MSTPFISVERVSMRYDSSAGAVDALRDVSLAVAKGEFVSVIGPSGCGKSTFLGVIGRLLAPTEGRIVFDGRELLEPTSRIGYVFQGPVLLAWRSVLQNVMLPSQLARRNAAAEQSRAREVLAIMGLSDFANHYPAELSGGMQQRAAIARALMLDPEVLLMDEPFGALDAHTRERMGFELQRVWQTTAKTVVFVTHSISEAVLLSDRVVAMSARPGRIDKIYSVDLPRPRRTQTMAMPGFIEACTRLREFMFGADESSAQHAFHLAE